MITIVLHWWFLPAGLLLVGLALAWLWPNDRYRDPLGWGTHVFWSPFKIGVVAACLLFAGGITVGHFL